jgi:hypothetical protein
MRWVCLGWGSLIWRPEALPLASEWHADGPALPIEFARQSGDGSLTLVIAPGVSKVPTLWATLAVADLPAAVEALRMREKCPTDRRIGRWPAASKRHPQYDQIANWTIGKGINGVVWTALPPKFEGAAGEVPSASEAVRYLRALEGDAAKKAELYVRNAPRQVRTHLRGVFERELGWLPLSDAP